MKPQQHKKPSIPPAEVWAWAQLQAWTQKTDRTLALILAEVKKIEPNPNVTPALEVAVNRVWMQAKRIDLQVPDLKKQC